MSFPHNGKEAAPTERDGQQLGVPGLHDVAIEARLPADPERRNMALTTPSPPIVDPELFRFIAALEVHKAARLRYPLSLLTFEWLANAELLAAARSVARVIRCTDVMTSQPERPSDLQILLIDATPTAAQAVIWRLREVVPPGDVVRCRVRSFPATATSLDDLLSAPSTSTDALPKGMDNEEPARPRGPR